MTKDEALKLALEALEYHTAQTRPIHETYEAIKAINEALAQPPLPVQEPYDQTALELCNVCGWKTLIPTDGCLNCERKPLPAQPPLPVQPVQLVSWTGNGSAEWREINAPTGFFYQVDGRTQPEERNFCQRCGKRTADLTTIHTCTPPQIDPNQWAFDNGLEST